jgi:hypothetical protein
VSDSAFDDYTFPPNFQIALGELPRGGADSTHVFDYVPADTQVSARSRIVLRIEPHASEPWLGVFAPGLYGVPPAATDRIITMPGGERFCVVTEGSGYIVSATDANDWQEVATYPITDVRVVASHDLVVFADFTNLCAYGASGEAWNSGQLVWDDLKIVRIEPEHIVARGWNAPDDSFDEFTVDLTTGEPHGQPYDSPDR